MSKLYNRPRTPPSPPSFSQKSSTSRGTRHDSHKSYDEPSKSYSSRDYEKYSSYDKYGKSEKYDRYDKLDKSSYKSSSYLSSKEYGLDYSLSGIKGTGSTASNQSEKYYGKSSSSRSSYHGDDSYRSKERVYVDQSYSDRDPYLSKYPPRSNDKYSKYSPPSTKGISDSKYSKHVMRGSVRNSVENDKYSPYPPTNKSTSLPYSKFGSGSNSFYPKNDSSYGSYDNYDRSRSQSHLGRGKEDGEVRGFSEGSQRRESGKSYSNSEPSDSYGGGYQRYVIGNSVVYRSPGHYPKDLYPSSPKSKRDRSPHSPAPLLSSSKIRSSSGKNYSRYSPSPKRYTSSSTKGSSLREDSSYSRSSQSSSFRKPHSPPPHSYQGLSSHSHSKGDRASNSYTAPPDRGKVYNDRYDMPKSGRFYDQRDGGRDGLKSHGSRDFDSYRKKDTPYSKPYSYDRDSNPMPPREKYPSERPPAPLMSLKPQPLLSIPLSISSLPLESRANVRETLGIPPHKPLNGMDKGLRGRRLEGRIGSRKRLPLSPKDRKRRRPDDLRLWIEYRKNEGGKTNSANAKGRGQVKRPGRAIEGGTRSRMMDSRKRILNKGKKGGMLRREPRRLPPLKPKSRAHETKSSDTSKKIESSNSTEGRNRDEGSKRRKERTKGGDSDHGRGGESNRGSGSGRASGTTSSVRRPLVKRPKIVSQANRLPLKPRPAKRSSYRSSPDKEKSSSKSDKNYHHSRKSKTRERSRTPTRRAEKEDAPPSSSSSSRH